jgi:hypothetical protein
MKNHPAGRKPGGLMTSAQKNCGAVISMLLKNPLNPIPDRITDPNEKTLTRR